MLELLLYLLTMSGTPGPNTILSLQNASEKGLRKGIYLNYGMAAGILLVTTVTYLLISLLSAVIPSLSVLLQILSIVYILFLSWKMYNKRDLPSSSGDGSFRRGFLMQLVNVKVLMLCVSTISTFILPSSYSFLKGYLVSLSIPIMCFLTGLMWGVAGEALKSVYLGHRKAANTIFALSLLALAVKSIVTLLTEVYK